MALTAGYHGQHGGPVSQYMTPDPQTIEASMSIIDLASLFLTSRLRRHPVVQDYRLVGQISRRDVLRALETLSPHERRPAAVRAEVTGHNITVAT